MSLDRLGDPSAPARIRRRRERRVTALGYPIGEEPPGLALPARRAPPPPQEEEPKETPLVCVRCCTTPAQIAWSTAQGRFIHSSVIGSVNGGVRICGGFVVNQGEEWREAFEPGLVVPCFHTGAGVIAHLVRLGRPAQNGGPSWSGTALCGKTNSGRNRNWRPLLPASAAQAELCVSCREAQLLEEDRRF